MARLRAETVDRRRRRRRRRLGQGGRDDEDEDDDDDDSVEEEEEAVSASASGRRRRSGVQRDTPPGEEEEEEEEDRGTARWNAQLVAPPRTREEGRLQWEGFLRDRFVRGEDLDFEYADVDGDEEYDVLEREEREEAWFEAEDPGWVSDSGEGGEQRAAVLLGETGVQDF